MNEPMVEGRGRAAETRRVIKRRLAHLEYSRDEKKGGRALSYIDDEMRALSHLMQVLDLFEKARPILDNVWAMGDVSRAELDGTGLPELLDAIDHREANGWRTS